MGYRGGGGGVLVASDQDLLVCIYVYRVVVRGRVGVVVLSQERVLVWCRSWM